MFKVVHHVASQSATGIFYPHGMNCKELLPGGIVAKVHQCMPLVNLCIAGIFRPCSKMFATSSGVTNVLYNIW